MKIAFVFGLFPLLVELSARREGLMVRRNIIEVTRIIDLPFPVQRIHLLKCGQRRLKRVRCGHHKPSRLRQDLGDSIEAALLCRPYRDELKGSIQIFLIPVAFLLTKSIKPSRVRHSLISSAVMKRSRSEPLLTKAAGYFAFI